MHPGIQIAILACVVALTVVLVLAVLALRRTLARLEQVLAVLGKELGPTVVEAQGLMSDVRGLTQGARDELARVGALIDRVRDVSDKVGQAISAVTSLTRAGQLIGLATSLRTGAQVFFRRLRKP